MVHTKVTDTHGRYNFLVKPGQYTLELAKAGYVFPTEYLRGKTEDIAYLDLLTVPEFQTASDVLLARNIPADPSKKERAPWRVTFERIKRLVQHLVALSGPLVSVYVCYIQPTAFNFALAVVMFALYVFFGLFTKKRRPKTTAAITDAATGRPIAGAYVRIFDDKFNKLLETQITDRKGRYAFLVGRSRYYVTASKPGYVEARSTVIDLTTEQFVPFVAVNMALRVGQAPVATPPPSETVVPPALPTTEQLPPSADNPNGGATS
jgi:5-hydroxyisourate hydrolase-like protein (transthyretin family)